MAIPMAGLAVDCRRVVAVCFLGHVGFRAPWLLSRDWKGNCIRPGVRVLCRPSR
jgi:hypothetical protein